MKKYIIRAIKYFVYITLIMTVIIFVLAKLHLISTSVGEIFRNGWKSIWQIELMFLGVSAIYPHFGYTRRHLILPGEYSEIRPKVMQIMDSRGYSLETEDGENLTFRLDSKAGRVKRIWEDRITLSRDMCGFYMEGLSRDVIRLEAAAQSIS